MLKFENYPTKAEQAKEEIEKHLKGMKVTVITDNNQNLRIDFTQHEEPVYIDVDILGPNTVSLEMHDAMNTYFGRLRIAIDDYGEVVFNDYSDHLFLIECTNNNGVDIRAQYQIYTAE